MMLKVFPLVHFWNVLLLKEQMTTSVRKTFETLVWSAQNRSIPSKICPENIYEIGQIPVKSADFSVNLALRIPQNLTFFSLTYQKLFVDIVIIPVCHILS